MRAKTAQADAILANPSHLAAANVVVGDENDPSLDGGYFFTADAVLSVEIKQSVDAHRTARVTLLRQQGQFSNSPLVGHPYYLQISVGMPVAIRAVLHGPDAVATAPEDLVFQGYVDEVNFEDDEMLLVCTDKSAKLRDTWIEVERVYGLAQGANATKGCLVWAKGMPSLVVGDLVLPSQANANGHYYRVTASTGAMAPDEPGTGALAGTPWPTGSGATVVSGGVTFTEAGATSEAGIALETLLQQLLNDNGVGWLTQLQVPVSPAWQIKPYVQQRESVMSALETLVDQLGWWLRFEYVAGLGSYELTLKEPDRTSTTVHKTVNQDGELECTELSIGIWPIRNVVKVMYSESANRDPNGDPTRATFTASDTASIVKYGRRFMEVAEASSSAIDTLAEATRLANAILADLKEPTMAMAIAFSCDPYVELGDRLLIKADGLRFSSDQTLAVESITQRIEADGARTSVTLRGQPTARQLGWLTMEGRVAGTNQETVLNATSSTTTQTNLLAGVQVLTSEARTKGAMGAQFEWHVSDVANFTPTAATRIDTSNGFAAATSHLIPGKTYYLKSIPLMMDGGILVRGSPSREIQFTASRVQSGHYDSSSTQSHLPLNGNFEHALIDPDTYPLDQWSPQALAGEGAESWGLTGSVFYGVDSNKGRFVRLMPHSSKRGRVVSSVFEVRRGLRAFNIYLSLRRNGSSAPSGKDMICDVYGFSDSGLTQQVINYSVYFSGSASGPLPSLGVWYDSLIDFGGGYGAIPTNVNFMQIVLRRGTAGDSSFSWDIGDVYVQESDFYRAIVDNLTVNASASLAQSGWASPSLSLGWENVGFGWQTSGYFKDSIGVVHLRGNVVRSSGTETVIFNLPAGFRPSGQKRFVVDASLGHGVVDVLSGGNVVLLSGNPGSYLSLEGITFDTRS